LVASSTWLKDNVASPPSSVAFASAMTVPQKAE
jgi:hypothetical protein